MKTHVCAVTRINISFLWPRPRPALFLAIMNTTSAEFAAYANNVKICVIATVPVSVAESI